MRDACSLQRWGGNPEGGGTGGGGTTTREPVWRRAASRRLLPRLLAELERVEPVVRGGVHRHLSLRAAALLHHSRGGRVTLCIPLVPSHQCSSRPEGSVPPDPLAPAHPRERTHARTRHHLPDTLDSTPAQTAAWPDVRKGLVQGHIKDTVEVIPSYLHSHTYPLTASPSGHPR